MNWSDYLENNKSQYTGELLDFVSIPSISAQDEHFDECPINHTGSAASMESTGAVTLWSRSVEKYNLRYTTFIGN